MKAARSARVNSGVMRFRGNEGNMIFRAIVICLCLLASLAGVIPQQNISASRKFDEFGDLIADNEMVHLDAFALELNKNSNSTGYIVGYYEQHIPAGHFLRRIHGYRNYLVNKRGVNPNLVKVVEGGNREKRVTELWLAPNGDSAPKPSPEMQLDLKSPLKFDEVSMGVGCEPEFTLDLYELDDGLKFYANVLRVNPNAQVWIIAYPNRRSRLSTAVGVARHTKDSLVRDFNIEANRIITKVSNRRQACMKAEIWIVPVGAVPSAATHNNSLNRTRN